jgi:hypothetical protein
VDDSGVLYSTSPSKHCIYRAKLGVDNKATVFVGNELLDGMVDATGAQARFNQPWGLVLGLDGNIYAADFDNHRIRRVTPEGIVTTVAGNGNGTRRDGFDVESSFYYPMYLACHPRDMVLYVLEGEDEDTAIRSVDAETGVVATIYSASEGNQFPAPAGPQAFLTPPASPPSKDIEAGSGDAISSDDIEEGSVVGQIVGEGGVIAKKSYYFPASLQNLLQQGPSKFIDPITRKKIVDVKWYKAHLVPEGTLGGRKTRKVKKSKKRTTYRVNRKKTRTPRKR